MESCASISTRIAPFASLTTSIVASSVTRKPATICVCNLAFLSLDSICGRAPCTSTNLTSKLASRFKSWERATNWLSSTTSPPNAMTKVLPPNAWMYGATERNQLTNSWGLLNSCVDELVKFAYSANFSEAISGGFWVYWAYSCWEYRNAGVQLSAAEILCSIASVKPCSPLSILERLPLSPPILAASCWRVKPKVFLCFLMAVPMELYSDMRCPFLRFTH